MMGGDAYGCHKLFDDFVSTATDPWRFKISAEKKSSIGRTKRRNRKILWKNWKNKGRNAAKVNTKISVKIIKGDKFMEYICLGFICYSIALALLFKIKD